MSQFFLGRRKVGPDGSRWLKDVRDDFHIAHSKVVFNQADYGMLCVIDHNGSNIDDLFVSAQKQMLLAEVEFNCTALSEVLLDVLPALDLAAFWYGSDSVELNAVSSVAQLLAQLEQSIRQPTCEAYVRFSRLSLE